jgi:hypothetical protein
MAAKVTTEFPFEAVLGKTRRTEFQRGRGKHRNLDSFAALVCCASPLYSEVAPIAGIKGRSAALG